MTVLLVLIGLPSSGKSTLASKIVENLGYSEVSIDKFRRELGIQLGDFEQHSRLFEVVYKEIGRLLSDGKDVVYDATNIDSTYRSKLLDRMRGKTSGLVGIFLNTQYLICLQRNRQKEGQGAAVPEREMEIMNRLLFQASSDFQTGFDHFCAAHTAGEAMEFLRRLFS